MENQLIFVDTKRIKETKVNLEKSLVVVKEIYDRFLKLGIELTLKEVQNLTINATRNDLQTDWLKEFVADKFLLKAGQPSFNGVPINQDKLKDLLDIPDVSDLKTYLYSCGLTNGFGVAGQYFKPVYFKLENGIISIADTANEDIEKQFSHYTKNVLGETASILLGKVSQSLNDYEDFLRQNGFLSKKFAEIRSSKIKGLNIENDEYQPSIEFIREVEARAKP